MERLLDTQVDKGVNRDTAADGRFLIAAAGTEGAVLSVVENEVAAARAELDRIFSGEFTKPAERLYWQGLDDVARSKKITAIVSLGEVERQVLAHAKITVNCDIGQPTVPAQFHTHVEGLTARANEAYDMVRPTND